MRICISLVFACVAAAASAQGPRLDLPPRKADAVTGSAFANQIETLPLEERENRIFEQVKQGNVPSFLRNLVPVEVSDGPVTGKIYVAPDDLAIGSDDDYFLVPMTPYTAQRIADLTHCTLPTPKMSDEIYAAAPLKMTPTPIPPSPAMTTVPVFERMNRMVWDQRKQFLAQYPLGTLVAGDKKDIVIAKGLADLHDRVAIYGWHRPGGIPIQPLYLGHVASWADYSHGVRLISRDMDVKGKACDVLYALKDPILSGLLSSEGPLTQPNYVFGAFPRDFWSESFTVPPTERIEKMEPVPGVRVIIDEPAKLSSKVKLVLFALPNGNTIEQTFGRRMEPGMDWHYDIQNIGAQTRFLRPLLPDESLVVAYLETNRHSWPSWFGSHDIHQAVSIVDAVEKRFSGHEVGIVLDSHSGGGSFIFAYIEAVDSIPDRIERIAWIDSEYRYNLRSHQAKLANWLKTPGHSLCAIAYDDSAALLQGKPFVTPEGGTWGRTHAMLQDLSQDFAITRADEEDPQKYVGLNGRIVFWLKQNPKHEILHTVQVEKNGFIESVLSGTPQEGKGYRYFGDRAYSRYIED